MESPPLIELHPEIQKANNLMLEKIRSELPSDANIPGTYNNGGLYVMQRGNYALAWSMFCEGLAALEDGKDDLEAILCDNMATCAKHLGHSEAAINLYTRAIRRNPAFEKPHQNVSLLLLRECQFKMAWLYYRKRFLARQQISQLTDPVSGKNFKDLETVTRRQLNGARIALVNEQGLGDTLCFMRFAERTERWGAEAIYFVPPPRLAKRLKPRYGPVQVVDAFPDTCQIGVPIGDLPLLTGHGDVEDDYPAPMEILPNPEYQEILERCLKGFPRPWTGLQWRSGVLKLKHAGGIYKEYPFDLVEALADRLPGTKIILQRNLTPLEVQWLRGRNDVVNLSAVSDDLDRVCAVLPTLDRYITVSNTNVHLGAGLGLEDRMTILSTFPSEWRWAEGSRWFSPAQIVRQQVHGVWPEFE